MIAIDWGTSAFRAYRIDAAGSVLERCEAARGILTVENGAFATVLTEEIGDWLRDDPGPIMMSGMIGSRQGWREMPYLECPVDTDTIARACGEIDCGFDRRAFVVPGLTCRDRDGVRDVMRGEETQIIGALDELGASALLCLPGTHSKYVTMRDRRIERFETHMTGEIFALLWCHSILGRVDAADRITDKRAFDAGVDRAGDSRGLLHHLFGVRARHLFDEIAAGSVASYLSGILIGHEIRSARISGPIVLIGAPELSRLYRRALTRLGAVTRVLAGEPAARGLWRLACAMKAMP